MKKSQLWNGSLSRKLHIPVKLEKDRSSVPWFSQVPHPLFPSVVQLDVQVCVLHPCLTSPVLPALVNLFLHTPPIPLMWPGQVPSLVWWAACGSCWLWVSLRTWGQGVSLHVESLCGIHVFVDSIPKRWTRHSMKDAAGEQWCLPKGWKREMQPAEKKREARLNP